ncbi:glycosyl transferase family 2 protein [Gigaspora margarita]|uniref:Glycosyl transferase family 2 protein n=1 Tax=Gigaspora margarita TaxID=4874 RepID=A0A8H4AR61_GIGMA|nr:glycosyl transferase family 2 protein [Gigaspora margarita]
MAYSDRISYRPLYQKQTYSIWMFPRIFRSIAACLSLIIFIAIPVIHLNKRHIETNSSLFHKVNDNKPFFNSISKNIIVVIDGDQQATSLQPIYCKLSKKVENVYTHVIVTGKNRGMSGTRLIRFNSLFSNCDVSVYDLELRKGISSNENILPLVFQGINHALDQIRPDVLIYINDPENEAMRAVDAALVAASQSNNHITKIAIPIEHTKHLMWLTDLSFESLKNWNTPKIHLQIITQNRPESLTRLIKSLNSSIYIGDDVSLTINMDRGADPDTLKFSQTLDWTFGQKIVRHRVIQGGLLTAVVESYYPSDDNDYAIILEDDIELSPFYYIWAKYGVLKYRYSNDRNLSGRMFGISLYNIKINELNMAGRIPFNPALNLRGTKYPNQSPYLSQVPCSWGALYFPEIWREFRIYQNVRLNDALGLMLQDVKVPESRSNRWSKSWKRFFIELTYLRGYVMLYPNYENFISFSTNHFEKGEHNRVGKKKDPFQLPLMNEYILLDGLPGNRLPNFKDLPIMDLWGKVTSPNELIQRGRALQLEISSCPPNDFGELTYDPQDLLCVDEENVRIKMMNQSKSNENSAETPTIDKISNPDDKEKDSPLKEQIIPFDDKEDDPSLREQIVPFDDKEKVSSLREQIIPLNDKEDDSPLREQIIPFDDKENNSPSREQFLSIAEKKTLPRENENK